MIIENKKLNIKIFLKILVAIALITAVIFCIYFYLNKDNSNFTNNKYLQYFTKINFNNTENKVQNETQNRTEGKIIDGVKLPPDPGEEGKKTLAGIDSDKDGIRDDVQIAIYERYPSNPEIRKILFDNAKNMQDKVIAGAEGDRNKILKIKDRSRKAIACLVENLKDSYYEDLTFLGTKVRNTKERIFAYEDFSIALNGTFWGTVDCEE